MSHHTTRPPAFARLPTELLTSILVLLTPSDLATLRLASKHTFLPAASHEYFAHLRLYPNRSSLAKLDAISRVPAYARAVKRLTYSVVRVFYREDLYNSFDDWYMNMTNNQITLWRTGWGVREGARFYKPYEVPLGKEDARGVHQTYRDAVDGDRWVDGDGVEVEGLSGILARFEGLREVFVTTMEDPSHVDASEGVKRVFRRAGERMWIFPTPLAEKNVMRHCLRMMIALERARPPRLVRIGFENLNLCNLSASEVVEALRMDMPQASCPLAGLHELELCLDAEEFHLRTRVDLKAHNEHLTLLTTLTRDIECLKLKMCITHSKYRNIKAGRDLFEFLMAEDIWPKLKSLHLSGSVTQCFLQRFLRQRARKLRHLTLENIELLEERDDCTCEAKDTCICVRWKRAPPYTGRCVCQGWDSCICDRWGAIVADQERLICDAQPFCCGNCLHHMFCMGWFPCECEGWVRNFEYIRDNMNLDSIALHGIFAERKGNDRWSAPASQWNVPTLELCISPAREYASKSKPDFGWTKENIEAYMLRKSDINPFIPVKLFGKLIGWQITEDESWFDGLETLINGSSSMFLGLWKGGRGDEATT